MATTKKRINISLSRSVEKAIAKLAKRDKLPEATKAGELLRLALEIEEDYVFDALTQERDVKGVRWITHENVWGKRTARTR